MGLGLTAEPLQWVVSSTGASEHKASLCFLPRAILACFLLLGMPISVYLGNGIYLLCNCLIEK